MPEKRIGVSHHAAWKRLLLAISAGALLLLVNNSPALGQSQEPGKIVQLAMNDAQIREQILRETAGSKLLQAMKRHFPEDYEAMIAMQIDGYKHGDDTQTLTGKSAQFTADLRRRNALNFMNASMGAHRAYVAGLLPMLDHLQARYGFKACNALSFGGGPALMETIGGEALAADPVMVVGLDEMGGLFLSAAAEGAATPSHSGEPTDADWQAMLEALDAAGLEQHEIDLAMSPDRDAVLADPQYCDVSMKWIAELVKLSGDGGARIIRVIAGAAAGSL